MTHRPLQRKAINFDQNFSIMYGMEEHFSCWQGETDQIPFPLTDSKTEALAKQNFPSVDHEDNSWHWYVDMITHWGQNEMDAIFKWIFAKENYCIGFKV